MEDITYGLNPIQSAVMEFWFNGLSCWELIDGCIIYAHLIVACSQKHGIVRRKFDGIHTAVVAFEPPDGFRRCNVPIEDLSVVVALRTES